MYENLRFKTVADNCFHILIFLLLCCILWIPINYYRGLLSWHAILATISFLLLMSESITLFSNNFWFGKIERSKKIRIHGVVFIIATICAILAGIFEYLRKAMRKGHNHFSSIHSISGLLAIIITIIACVVGFLAANPDWFQRSRIKPLFWKMSHNIFGQIAYVIGMFSLCWGFYTHWYLSRTTTEERIILVLATVVITLWTLINAVKSVYNQITSVTI